MTLEGLGEMFEGDSSDTCTRKFPLELIGGRKKGLACAQLSDHNTKYYFGPSGVRACVSIGWVSMLILH
jgi:hypothetical protein